MSKRLILVLALFGVLAVILWLTRERWWPAAKRWFAEPTSPFNLAIFRIVVFSLILVTGDLERTRFFAELPPALIYPPEKSGWLPFPLASSLSEPILWIFFASTIAAIAGLFTRWSAALSTLTGLYVLGVPNWFGKVNHSHHLLWLAALLALTPCADALSLDGIRRAWARADSGDVAPPQPASIYGVPLRFLILVLGLAYFFPGFYKMFTVGPAWLKPDSLRLIMHEDWSRMGHWLPPIRLDTMPMALMLGAIGSVGFELLFLPMALWKRTRMLAAAGGLVFHNMTYLNMGIRFGTVQWLYVGFVDWKALFEKLGRRLAPLTVLYDGECRFCRRAIASLATLDLIGAFQAVDFRQREAIPPELPEVPDTVTLDRDIHMWDGSRYVTGVAAYERLLRRIPILWPLWPFLVLPLFKRGAEALYRKVADSRHLLIGAKQASPAPPGQPRSAIFVGTLILLWGVAFGVKRYVNSWPVACYPPYDHAGGPTIRFLAFEFEGKVFDPVLDPAMRKTFLPNRLNGLCMKIAHDPDPEHGKAAADALLWVWSMMSKEAPGLGAKPILAEESTDPAHWAEGAKKVSPYPSVSE